MVDFYDVEVGLIEMWKVIVSKNEELVYDVLKLMDENKRWVVYIYNVFVSV